MEKKRKKALDILLPVQEVSNLIGVSRRTVNRMIERGELQSRSVLDVMTYRENQIKEKVRTELIESLREV